MSLSPSRLHPHIPPPSRKLKHPTNKHSVRGRPHYYSTKKEEYASIRFNLDADLSSLLTWNTKSIYLSINAQWTTPCTPLSPCSSSSQTNTTNEAVIYDTIITSPSADHLATISTLSHMLRKDKKAEIEKGGKSKDKTGKGRGLVKLGNQKPKYTITAPGGKVGGLEGVRLVVRYNVNPWVGALAWDQKGDFGGWKAMEGGTSEVITLPHVKVKKVESTK